jgi:hypothetical protein
MSSQRSTLSWPVFCGLGELSFAEGRLWLPTSIQSLNLEGVRVVVDELSDQDFCRVVSGDDGFLEPSFRTEV